MQINSKLTTVTITYNNVIELEKTLNSISRAECQPHEVIVVDGGSTDGSIELIESYKEKLPQLNFSSQSDNGIYDALNIGKRRVKTPLVHYLNAGDILYGNPYKGISRPALLPIVFIDENDAECGYDRVKWLGTSYNHQGLVISTSHEEFDLRFTIAADYKMLLREFPSGLPAAIVSESGGVKYQLGGVSSKKAWQASWQMIQIVVKERPLLGFAVAFMIFAKGLLPRRIRRWILKNY